MRGYLHLRNFDGTTTARLTAATNWHSVNVAPVLLDAVIKKIDGQQIYITGKERHIDGQALPHGWWITVLGSAASDV